MAKITIIISDEGKLGTKVETSEQRPSIGRVLTPAQALAMDILRQCGKQANLVEYGSCEPQFTRSAS